MTNKQKQLLARAYDLIYALRVSGDDCERVVEARRIIEAVIREEAQEEAKED